MEYFIKGNYYFDIDLLNQLRITGPENHLLLGLSFPEEVTVKVADYHLKHDQLKIVLEVDTGELTLGLPLVTDIRTLRSYTEPVAPTPSYRQLIEKGVQELLSKEVIDVEKDGRKYIECKNTYSDEYGVVNSYGAMIGVEEKAALTRHGQYFTIKGTKPLRIWIETVGTVKVIEQLQQAVFNVKNKIITENLPQFLQKLYTKAGDEIEHLIKTKKTSGFEYGTIFPRDWIESADLGVGDLSADTVDYMYRQSMKYISEHGEGWHEDLVGDYKSKISEKSLHIDRKMIDIEPKYILGFRSLSKGFLTDQEMQRRLQLVAQYVIMNASDHDILTFKKSLYDPNQYHFIGNWRDSFLAFPRQKAPLAPYDVNCVLYPESLKIIRDHSDYFGVDPEQIQILVTKWEKQKNKFRMYHPDEIIGYALALHGSKRLPLPVSHLDESYDLFYSNPSMEEVISFARKLMSEDYFYTPVGPILVANDEEDFTTHQYHGKVIWPKQVAFAVAGLTRQFRRALAEQWPPQVQSEIAMAIKVTAEACFTGWQQMHAVPELYYYDKSTDRARLYTDQKEYEGQMSIVQLWSSVGCRRIIRDYAEILAYVP